MGVKRDAQYRQAVQRLREPPTVFSLRESFLKVSGGPTRYDQLIAPLSFERSSSCAADVTLFQRSEIQTRGGRCQTKGLGRGQVTLRSQV